MSDFLKIARIALKDRPQFLEKLGVAAPARRAPRALAPVPAPTATTLDASAESVVVPTGIVASLAAERRNGRAAVNGRA